jgi:Fe-S cluster biogenesis protein NfuA/nitrite reductase/ring-hydroxylating ferredoxin subunit
MQINEMNPALTARTLDGRMRHFETLLEQIHAAVDPATQAKVEEVIRLLMELHGAGLERMLEVIWETGPVGQNLIQSVMAQDEVTSPLLLMHGLHPLSLETRVSQALEKVRPYMHSHGGDVQVVEISNEGVIKLKLAGTCHGCPSSRVTLKFAVEKAILEAAPDAAQIVVTGEPEPGVVSGWDPMTKNLVPGNQGIIASGASWIEVTGLASMIQGRVRIHTVADIPVLFCQVEDSLYAYTSQCPKCTRELGQAKLAGSQLACPGCGHHFDIMRAGRDLDEPALQLAPFPLIREGAVVKIAL